MLFRVDVCGPGKSSAAARQAVPAIIAAGMSSPYYRLSKRHGELIDIKAHRPRRPIIVAMTRFLSVTAALLPVSASAADAPVEPYPWMHQMMWGAGGYGMIFGPLFMILMLALVIAVAVLIVRAVGGPWHRTVPLQYQPPSRTPLDILKERFARGEIDKNEFEDRRRVLGE